MQTISSALQGHTSHSLVLDISVEDEAVRSERSSLKCSKETCSVYSLAYGSSSHPYFNPLEVIIQGEVARAIFFYIFYNLYIVFLVCSTYYVLYVYCQHQYAKTNSW